MALNGIPAAQVFTASFTASLTTTDPRDLMSVLASSISRVQVFEVIAGIVSTGITDAQNVGITLLRGSTAAAVGSAIPVANHNGWTAAPSAGSSCSGNSTNLGSTTSATQIHADVTQAGRYCYKPWPDYAPILEKSQRLHVRATAPTAQPITVHGSITFAEIGQKPF